MLQPEIAATKGMFAPEMELVGDRNKFANYLTEGIAPTASLEADALDRAVRERMSQGGITDPTVALQAAERGSAQRMFDVGSFVTEGLASRPSIMAQLAATQQGIVTDLLSLYKQKV